MMGWAFTRGPVRIDVVKGFLAEMSPPGQGAATASATMVRESAISCWRLVMPSLQFESVMPWPFVTGRDAMTGSRRVVQVATSELTFAKGPSRVACSLAR